jgi:DNA-binding response OmpR family regulator
LANGMDNYLSKPIRPQELDDVLEKYLALRKIPANTSESLALHQRLSASPLEAYVAKLPIDDATAR